MRPCSKGAGIVKSWVKSTNSFLCLPASEILYRSWQKNAILRLTHREVNVSN
nr:MAG TPA_asm: hypothetical protein [Bacteriophage sp.]DAL74320.1 MAG TPA: hypothetical protein [Caudoviricetes sp.]DAT98147.1 MAG TPA: hypothetical protein [Caudoviricetes sp.]